MFSRNSNEVMIVTDGSVGTSDSPLKSYFSSDGGNRFAVATIEFRNRRESWGLLINNTYDIVYKFYYKNSDASIGISKYNTAANTWASVVPSSSSPLNAYADSLTDLTYYNGYVYGYAGNKLIKLPDTFASVEEYALPAGSKYQFCSASFGKNRNNMFMVDSSGIFLHTSKGNFLYSNTPTTLSSWTLTKSISDSLTTTSPSILVKQAGSRKYLLFDKSSNRVFQSSRYSFKSCTWTPYALGWPSDGLSSLRGACEVNGITLLFCAEKNKAVQILQYNEDTHSAQLLKMANSTSISSSSNGVLAVPVNDGAYFFVMDNTSSVIANRLVKKTAPLLEEVLRGGSVQAYVKVK